MSKHSTYERLIAIAQQGNSSAQYALGTLFADKEDFKEAAKWFQMASEQGYVKAQCELGYLYMIGKGVEQDFSEARKWFHMAAEQGYGDAHCYIGIMCELTNGGKNTVEAIQCYRKAIELGSAIGAYQLAFAYMTTGRGVKFDIEEAAKWFRLAADWGNTQAQYELGNLYQNGLGVEQDLEEAVKWYMKAAKQGNWNAQDTIVILSASDLPWLERFARQWGREDDLLHLKRNKYNESPDNEELTPFPD